MSRKHKKIFNKELYKLQYQKEENDLFTNVLKSYGLNSRSFKFLEKSMENIIALNLTTNKQVYLRY